MQLTDNSIFSNFFYDTISVENSLYWFKNEANLELLETLFVYMLKYKKPF